SRLIDLTFNNLDINLVQVKGMSLASSNWKNIERSKRIEFDAVEAGHKWEEKNGTKYLTDSLKLCKMMKDMLTQLSIECNGVEDLVRKIQVVGILNGANMIQVITIDYPKGYISHVQCKNIREVAGRLSKSDLLTLVLKEEHAPAINILYNEIDLHRSFHINRARALAMNIDIPKVDQRLLCEFVPKEFTTEKS
ncbi:10238_t:CDS:2, partial [Funneliformis mosseae]